MELLEGPVNYYVVMELVTGGDLCKYIVKEQKFSEQKVAQIIHQIFLAINYMHQLNIVHRDLKPENVLIMQEEGQHDKITCKVTDFGFACQFAEKEGMTEILGTPLYMAPEIVYGENYDSKVDVWSIGVITYIMLTGAPPFWGKTQNAIYQSIVQKKPTFGKAKKLLSQEAMDFVMSCLDKDPAKRATAEQCLNNPWL